MIYPKEQYNVGNEDSQIVCLHTGPVIWMHNKSRLEQGLSERGHILTIENPTTRQSGTYSCIGTDVIRNQSVAYFSKLYVVSKYTY